MIRSIQFPRQTNVKLTLEFYCSWIRLWFSKTDVHNLRAFIWQPVNVWKEVIY